jgi:hypothetical protein
VVGAATSLASGLLNDNLTLKGVLRGALSGALTAGLMQGVGEVVGNLGTVGSIAARSTVQGAVQALMGGKFADGALAGLASRLAEVASTNMLNAINTSGMTGAEAVAARTFARVIGSAIRAAASPGDPGQAFASAFLDDVFKQIDTGTPITQTAFDDEGRLNLGIVDPNASPDQQAQQLAAQLQRQGIPPAQANLMAQQALGNIVDGVAQLPQPSTVAAVTPPLPTTASLPLVDPFSVISSDDEVSYGDLLADQLGVPRDDLVDVGLRDYAGRSAQVALGFIEGAGFSVIGTGEAMWEIAKSPGQFINGVKTLLNSAEARAQFGADVVAGVKVDLQMLEDAFNNGDLRGVGQQLGKLTTDLAQVAGGVGALAKLGVSTASAGGRLLLRSVDDLGATRLISASKGGATSIDQAATGIKWGEGINAQGMPWENYLARGLPAETRLPPGFKTFDFFDLETGVATSAKTLDTLTDAKLAKPSQIYTSLKGNIDKVADFERAELAGKVVEGADISRRVVSVAIPAGSTPAQWDQIAKVIQYGQSRGVVVKVTEIKP